MYLRERVCEIELTRTIVYHSDVKVAQTLFNLRTEVSSGIGIKFLFIQRNEVGRYFIAMVTVSLKGEGSEGDDFPFGE